MRVYNTKNLDENSMRKMSPNEAAWIYNGLDVCVTAEIFTTLEAQMKEDLPEVQATYDVALAKLAPIMEMSMRGTLIDEDKRQASLKALQADLDNLEQKFQRIIEEVFGCAPINWNSPTQLKNLFYGILQLKEVRKRNQQGRYVATTNKEALESFRRYIHARPFANFVLAMRDLNKQIGFLKTEIDPDQRIRCNYNIAGTNTGRLNSSMSDFGTGTNLQNVNRKLRFPFIADRAMILVNVDLEQADGRNVGAVCWNLFVDSHGPEFAGAYLDAAESGDLHTTVCRMVWPNLGEGSNQGTWPEDSDLWKDFCDSLLAHGQDSYRQLSKKGGHGTNYYGTPRTMAKHLYIAARVVEDFQKRYFTAFPCIPEWHKWVINQIKETGTLITPFGRRRMFFGRANDASTHRKAIAFVPQSMTGEQIDRGMLQIWRAFPEIQLLNQVHDSILFQLPFRKVETLLPKVLDTMKVTLELKQGREFTIPLDAATGWNWGYYNEDTNPYGMKAWKGQETRLPPVIKRRFRDHLRK